MFPVAVRFHSHSSLFSRLLTHKLSKYYNIIISVFGCHASCNVFECNLGVLGMLGALAVRI